MIRGAKNAGVFVSLIGGVAVLSACPAVLDDRCSENACVAVDAGSDGDDLLDVVIPPGCDLTKSPKESPECVTDGVGVFVSPTGKDGAAGTKAEPLRSIAEAVTRRKPRVYVCEGEYEGAVTITEQVSLYGGFSCAWEPSDARVRLAPPKGVALKVLNVLTPIVVESVDIIGHADAELSGDSAVAAFVSESNVTFRGVNLVAGPGTPGEKGGTKSNYTGVAKNGGNATASSGGKETMCACADGKTSSSGGRGGTVGTGALDPTSGSANPAVGGINEGNNGASSCVPGIAGSPGTATTGGDGAFAPGTLTNAGWDSSKLGTAGEPGNPGQGGGGGGGITMSAQGGSGGACGGCGGGGGEPGSNGGSSFALLAYRSTVTIDGGTLTSGVGGKGGDGGSGQDGQTPGTTGLGACAGGSGGAGAGGSGGGGGAGGHSVPIGYVGTEPIVNGATLKPDAQGAGGSGGEGGKGPGNAGAKGKAGAEGKSQNSLSL